MGKYWPRERFAPFSSGLTTDGPHGLRQHQGCSCDDSSLSILRRIKLATRSERSTEKCRERAHCGVTKRDHVAPIHSQKEASWRWGGCRSPLTASHCAKLAV